MYIVSVLRGIHEQRHLYHHKNKGPLILAQGNDLDSNLKEHEMTVINK